MKHNEHCDPRRMKYFEKKKKNIYKNRNFHILNDRRKIWAEKNEIA